jgi:hypothetical protein
MFVLPMSTVSSMPGSYAANSVRSPHGAARSWRFLDIPA